MVFGMLIAAAARAAYSRSFSVPLLFDDFPTILNNPSIRHWGTALNPTGNTTATARPVLNLSLALNYALSGTNVWSYHALNLAIHVLAGLALFGILRRTLERRTEAATLVAFSAAMIWTLHPLQTEAVTYTVQRAESLMGLFYLLTLYFFIRGCGADGSARNGWHAAAIAACLLGMGTKEVMVSAPVIVLLYDRTFVSGSFREAWARRRRVYAGLSATWILLGALFIMSGGNRGSDTTGVSASGKTWAYYLTQFPAICQYLRLSFWPSPLVFEYGTFWVKEPLSVLPQAIAVVALAFATLWALWRRPVLGFLGFWFFAILAPTSLVPGTLQMIVEHRMYLALAPVVVLPVAAIFRWTGRWALPICLAISAALLVCTWERNEVYSTAESIWSDTVAKRPENDRALFSLGTTWLEMHGHDLEAKAEFEHVLRINPDSAEAHYNLGITLTRLPGRTADGVAEFRQALRLMPDYADAHNNLGNVWIKTPGRLKDGIAQIREALRLKPDFAEAHDNLGNALLKIPGHVDEAIAELNEALRLKPEDSSAHDNLGVALMNLPGRADEAVFQFKEALRLNPNSGGAHYNLANVYSGMPGHTGDAIEQYEEAVRLNPDFADAHFNLATAFASVPGRLNEAIAQYEDVVRLTPDDAEARYFLAAALLKEDGHSGEARANLEAVLRLQPDNGRARALLAEIQGSNP
jgi:tetratricopeptide (TPR) repeat protein